MPTKEEQTIRSNALTLVNDARETEGREPLDALPAGRRGVPRSCPITLALHARSVEAASASFVNKERAEAAKDAWGAASGPFRTDHIRYRVELPVGLSYFIRAFDDGAYPDLDLEAEENGA
jgi:hypothetical protein